MIRSAILWAGLALSIAGCGGGGEQQVNGTAPPAAHSAASKTVPGKTGAATALPPYPGAMKQTSQYARQMRFCGHSASMTTYRTNKSAGAVAKWYKSRIPGAVGGPIHHVVTPGLQTITGSYLIVPDGSSGVVVEQLVLSGALARAQAGKNGTMIALTDYNPALAPQEMNLFLGASAPDPAMRKRAKAQLKAKCGPNGFSG